jgi:hypothetical protein
MGIVLRLKAAGDTSGRSGHAALNNCGPVSLNYAPFSSRLSRRADGGSGLPASSMPGFLPPVSDLALVFDTIPHIVVVPGQPAGFAV